MSTIQYKDFQGSVEFEDGRLIIRILHIDDFITAECDCASDAETVFKELVDEYFALCREAGRDPCRPFKGTFNIRVSPDLHRKAGMAAVSDGVSLNSWVEAAMTAHLERRVELSAFIKIVTRPEQAEQIIEPFGWGTLNAPNYKDRLPGDMKIRRH